MSQYEINLLTIRNVHLFQIPPRQTSRGYRATDWDPSKVLFTGRLRIVGKDGKCHIKFEDQSGQLFAQALYNSNGGTVEPVTDSSRYFVVTVEDPVSGKRAFLGLGFDERNDAFDFNVTLQESEKRIKQDKSVDEKKTTVQTGPVLDFSLKQGQSLNINIVPKKTAKGATDPNEDPFSLNTQAGQNNQKSSSNNNQTSQSGWVQF